MSATEAVAATLEPVETVALVEINRDFSERFSFSFSLRAGLWSALIEVCCSDCAATLSRKVQTRFKFSQRSTRCASRRNIKAHGRVKRKHTRIWRIVLAAKFGDDVCEIWLPKGRVVRRYEPYTTANPRQAIISLN